MGSYSQHAGDEVWVSTQGLRRPHCLGPCSSAIFLPLCLCSYTLLPKALSQRTPTPPLPLVQGAPQGSHRAHSTLTRLWGLNPLPALPSSNQPPRPSKGPLPSSSARAHGAAEPASLERSSCPRAQKLLRLSKTLSFFFFHFSFQKNLKHTQR